MGHAGGAGSDTTFPDPRLRDRIRWQARRGLLENDLLLTRFLDAELDGLADDELVALKEVLLLGDNDLLDLLMGRTTSANASHSAMIERIRAVSAS